MIIDVGGGGVGHLFGRGMGRVILETLQEIADGRTLVAALVDAGEERELIAGNATRFQDAYYVI